MNIICGFKNKHLGKAGWCYHSNIYKNFVLLFLSVPGRKLLKFQLWSWICLFLIFLIFATFLKAYYYLYLLFMIAIYVFDQLTLITEKYSSLTLAMSRPWNLLCTFNKAMAAILCSLYAWYICFSSFCFQSIWVFLFKEWYFYQECAFILNQV